MERLQDESETDAAVKGAMQAALGKVNRKLEWGEYAGVLFTGVSLGSILLLAALGLAITYGLMGVINMAHGELMMIGAYATFVVQTCFASTCLACLITTCCWRCPHRFLPQLWRARCSSARCFASSMVGPWRRCWPLGE